MFVRFGFYQHPCQEAFGVKMSCFGDLSELQLMTKCQADWRIAGYKTTLNTEFLSVPLCVSCCSS